MQKSRMEAFSDGVLAIIITIMVLEMKAPRGSSIADLLPILPVFISYVLSFLYIAIYWNNHHHLLQTVRHVNGKILWANINLLFWLSLLPFVTAWMGTNDFGLWPVVFYGIVLMMAGTAYYILTRTIIASHGKDAALSRAVGKDRKGILSLVVYAAGIALSFIHPYIGFTIYFIVSAWWLVPDKRIEKVLNE
jgi:uncharacterized membrane protein